MAEAITGRTRLIFVCNPNNPTGTVVREAALTRFLDQVPPGCLVVLDEAYHEYVRDPGVPDGLTLYPGRPNLVVLRTFSKAYGLAALRVGYLIGHEPVVAAVRKTQLPFAVNAVAQAAAIASLAAEAELMERVGGRAEGARAGRRRAARPGLGRTAERGQLRLAAARARRRPSSPRPAPGPASSCGRTRPTACGSRSARRRTTTRSWPRPGPGAARRPGPIPSTWCRRLVRWPSEGLRHPREPGLVRGPSRRPWTAAGRAARAVAARRGRDRPGQRPAAGGVLVPDERVVAHPRAPVRQGPDPRRAGLAGGRTAAGWSTAAACWTWR